MSTPSQAVDFSRYLPPGVYTNPTETTVLAINNAIPTAVALVGLSIGSNKFVQSIVINPDTSTSVPAINATLAQLGIDQATIVVSNPSTGQVYTLNTDYTVVSVNGTASGTAASAYAISRVISGHINVGQVVQISYTYTDASYYQPQVFYTYNDVVTMYGAPFASVPTTTNPNGFVVQSELTLGAKFAFLNGASQVMTVAVNPANPSAPNYGDYYNALQLLNDQALVSVVVPCSGSYLGPLNQAVQEHVDQQSASRFERRAILGMDGTAGNTVSSTQRIQYASDLYDERIALVSPTSFSYYSPELSQTINLGGQYIACALAGMAVSMSAAQPLTHKAITGFAGINDSVNDSQKSFESQNGLMVIEMAPPNGGRMWVRHGVTTNNADLFHREWNIVGQQDSMVYTLRAYLQNSNLIGQPIYDYTMINVKAAAEAGLQSLLVNGLIAGYNSLTVRQLITNPDVLEISYNWKPSMPLNYIVLTFGIDLSTGTVTSTGASPNASDFTTTQNTQSGLMSSAAGPSSSAVNDFGGASNTLQSD